MFFGDTVYLDANRKRIRIGLCNCGRIAYRFRDIVV